MKCNNCGADLADNAKFCTSCGANVEAQGPQGGPRHCPNCGSQLAEGASFCTNCGQKVGGPVNQGARKVENKLANTFGGNKNANLKNIGMIVGGVVVALLLIFFVFGPLFGGGKLTAKKAADIVEDAVEEAMDFDFMDTRKYFSMTAQDEYEYFVSPFQDFKTYYGDYTDKTLDDFMDIEVEPINFIYDKNTKTASGTFKMTSKVKKKYLTEPMITAMFGSDFSGTDTDTFDVEFIKEGKKWVITSFN